MLGHLIFISPHLTKAATELTRVHCANSPLGWKREVIQSILAGQDTDSNNPRIISESLIPFIHLTMLTPGNPSNSAPPT